MKKVVSATLAGALAVGMVPAMAFAAEADQEMDLLELDAATAIQQGTILFKAGQAAGDKFTAGTDNPYLVPVGVQPAETTSSEAVKAIDVVWLMKLPVAPATGTPSPKFKDGADYVKWAESAKCTVDANGKLVYVPSSGSSGLDTQDEIDNLAAGNYAIGVVADGQYVTQVVKFSVVAQELQGVQIYEKNLVDSTILTDESYTFNNTAWDFTGNDLNTLGLKIGGVALDTSKFTIKVYDKALTKEVTLKAAGDYVIRVTGNSGVYAGKSAEIPFTIAPLNLSNVNIVANDIQLGEAEKATTLASVGEITASMGLIDGVTDLGSYNALRTAPGPYTVEVVPDATLIKTAGFEGSVIGSKTVSFNVYGAAASNLSATYGADAFGNPAADLDIDYSSKNSDPDFDPSKVTVKAQDPVTKQVRNLTASEYNLKYYKVKGGNPVPCELADLKTPGEYRVYAEVNSSAFAYAIAGTTADYMTVEVTKGAITDTSVAFTYQGKELLVNTKSIEFTGSDILDDITVSVKTANGTVVPASEYEVVATTVNAKGQTVVVDEILNVGTYTLTVKSDLYTIADGYATVVITVTEKGITVTGVEGLFATKVGGTDVPSVLYTGKEITPVALQTVLSKQIAVPADSYTVKVVSATDMLGNAMKATSVKEPGIYTIQLVDVANDNYTLTVAPQYTFVVSNTSVYIDVPADAWFAEVVYDAKSLGYMTGYKGTKLFGAGDDITRGAWVCVLYNMANPTNGEDETDGSNAPGLTYKSFKDVEGTEYYAKALAWAKQAGVVNGYDDGTFKGDKNISRQEAIAMLANYAAAIGKYDAPTAAEAAAALAAYPDGAKVSGWAEEVFAWAVLEDIAGNGKVLNPTANIKREEAAAIAVNFQPVRPATLK
ncbi:MAG: S-layer homology domain-containing protein [Eggerthellaceae bacterium]|nr:S-layer homology domain-containing protein [Eggerthellaceae bacterium]